MTRNYSVEPIKEVYAKDLPKDQFPYEYMKFINPEALNTKVSYVVFYKSNNRATKSSEELNKLLNYRYVFNQLGIEYQKTDKREIWYNIQTILKRDYQMDMDMNFNSFGNAIVRYCQKLNKYLGFVYWGYIYDYLLITPKEEIVVYEPNLSNESLLNTRTIPQFAKTPFFLIISEKRETLMAVMEELYQKGYREGYYGINLGKQATSYGIKLLIELSNIRNLHIFVLHDLDIKGLDILFDMKKWIKRATIESIGINTEFLKFADIDFNDVCEDYNPYGSLIKGVRNRINKMMVSVEQKTVYRRWVNSCLERKIELNSITAYRILKDITKPKARDFVDYLIQKIEAKKWNLTRVEEFTRKKTVREFTRHILSREIEKTIKPEISFHYDRTPKIIIDVDSKKSEVIKKEQEAFTTELDNILSDIQEKYDDISLRLTNIKDMENDNAINKLLDFNEEFPELFDVNWKDVLEKRMGKSLEIMKSTVKGVRKYYELKSLRAFLKRKIELTKYDGNIKNIKNLERVVSKSKRDWEIYDISKYSNEGRSKLLKLRNIVKKQLRKTEEYKTAHIKATELLEEFENIEDDTTDERVEILEAFKEEMEQMFSNLSNELDKLEEENN